MSKIYDVVILGSGPAGLAAGLYAGRGRLSTLIVEKAQEGGCVLLSPACASFDMFKDFEDRGRIFKEKVMALR